ncbi:triphosphoribosyl-dephospho-CoA synthase MdcB [Polynucleobacter sp. JS-Mosq-20-D10]|uniref:triphosphoribosyl-dephospho-CoA synthase MdcB n=1 Tax=Polynucleobacter sp. JS-Mosq-20-D10 TaxID=2576922 RepID=UPI001BFDC0BC|nr:triphosphoribosyl-dephospho-CoA synthase MdcB [Polynucleobacter sp. JS-Mosq-20-D10]QWE01308.1 triphosphoribosyl-dephospho-CoA synthase MdcB [Polynucleobacter sp. JS-Mosq-20-D10]
MLSSSVDHLVKDKAQELQQNAVQYLRKIRNCAVQSLWHELVTYPKPGLVSLVDSGSHQDMDANTFYSSIVSLRHYFFDIASLGLEGSSFAFLRSAGLVAEARMLRATDGVNTHRGAIFNLGMLAAAAAYQYSQADTTLTLGEITVKTWGEELALHRRKENSHGSRVASTYHVGGAIQEVVSGYPSVYKLGLPVYRNVLTMTSSHQLACIQTFFTLLANVEDSNLLHRGGREGLERAQGLAQVFLDEGGIHLNNWDVRAFNVHRQLIAQNLSPGGCADLLSACLFVHQIESR